MEINMKTTAMVHSLNSMDEVVIERKVGDNNYVANYKGTRCSAIFNPFREIFYVDDVYGKVCENA